ncbi:MAG: alcohol dehydrogenase family protein [Gammaproteobacteria bacterium]|nr:alcohol dehydrogenase family protein [Gammaproteobacteria bacterium]
MLTSIPAKMAGVQLMGHGDVDQLVYRTDIPVPQPAADEVLIRVGAAGINNTDINTRIGWYAKSVRGATGETAKQTEDIEGGSWSGAAMKFPRIQGLDCCGTVVAVGAGVDAGRIGDRVLVRPMQSLHDADNPYAFVTFGSEMDGAFAQYAKVASRQALAVDCDWSDVELASLPCAYSTAEGMLTRAGVGAERVLITGASGGVGSAAVQLAKRRGAEIVAVAAEAKAADVRALGADRIVFRGQSIRQAVRNVSIDVVIDIVGGPQWPELCDVLRAGGRYVTSGAIAGPIVELDLRTLYLKDLTLFGSTYQPDEIFTNLIGYVERDEIRPVVAKTYPLKDIVVAQQEFLAKRHTGKLVLLP